MAPFPLPRTATSPHQSLNGAYDMVARYLATLGHENSLLAFANQPLNTGRIDARARGLSSAASHAANQALLNDLLAEASTLGQEVWIGDGEFPCHVLTLYPHQRIDGTGTRSMGWPLTTSRSTASPSGESTLQDGRLEDLQSNYETPPTSP